MFKGSIPALITPFNADGSIDFQAFRAFIDWQIAQGSHGLVPCGTTGESPTLSEAEHIDVVAACVEQAAGRVPVIAGVGSNATATTVQFMKEAKAVGADGALVVTPYYNKPNPAGLIAHFTAVHDAAELPIIIYNIPGRSVIDMKSETMAQLATLPRIVGVKDATGDLARVPDARLTCGRDFCQLSGEDATAVGFNAMGGVGCISVTANVAPALCAQIQQACLDGDYATALALQDTLLPLHQAMFCEPSPGPAKYAASRLGLCRATLRLPLFEPSEAAKSRIDAAIKGAGLIR